MVAMATYIFHRVIVGKVKIDMFSVSMGIFGIYFTDMFIEKSSTFHMAFVQIAEFDLLPGRQKCTRAIN